MEEGKEKKKIVILGETSAETESLLIRVSAFNLAQKGDTDAMKILQELQARERFDNLLTNCDNDEYEFAG